MKELGEFFYFLWQNKRILQQSGVGILLGSLAGKGLLLLIGYHLAVDDDWYITLGIVLLAMIYALGWVALLRLGWLAYKARKSRSPRHAIS